MLMDSLGEIRAVAADAREGVQVARELEYPTLAAKLEDYAARLTAAADALVPLLEYVDKHAIVVGHYNMACEENERLQAENATLKARVAEGRC